MCGVVGGVVIGQGRALVQPSACRGARAARGHAGADVYVASAYHQPGDGHPGVDDILQILFQCLHDQLFHLLSYREIRCYGTAVAILPLCLFGCLCHRYAGRRFPGRPLRPQVCHPFLYSRGGAFYARHALSWVVGHYRYGSCHRAYHRLGLLGHRCLCHRPAAR